MNTRNCGFICYSISILSALINLQRGRHQTFLKRACRRNQLQHWVAQHSPDAVLVQIRNSHPSQLADTISCFLTVSYYKTPAITCQSPAPWKEVVTPSTQLGSPRFSSPSSFSSQGIKRGALKGNIKKSSQADVMFKCK